MVMTEWMRAVKKALETVPKDTPNRLRTAMEKAKLTYKNKGSSKSSQHVAMKKTHRRRRSGKGRKGMRKSGRSRKHHKGGAPKLNPSEYDGKGVGTSGVGVQIDATTRST